MPAVNPDRPLAPIFISHSAPRNPETGPSQAILPNAPAEPEITSQQETFVRPLPDPSQLLNDFPFEEEADGISEPGADCNGIDGDAAEASSVFADDSDEESLTKFPTLVMEAFHKQIEYLKQITELEADNWSTMHCGELRLMEICLFVICLGIRWQLDF
jgi:hypothetical protein